jgi:hypothetical protein
MDLFLMDLVPRDLVTKVLFVKDLIDSYFFGC